jgi:TRAP-type C4-dicarboxylate transport system substrate-binding protein
MVSLVMARRTVGRAWFSRVAWTALLSMACTLGTASAAPYAIRVVGGLDNVDQYRKFEEPFWTRQLAELTDGQAVGTIVPFDKAGIRNHEVLRLMQLGVVPFATVLLSGIVATEPELAAIDLAGLNPDLASLQKTVQAYRPHLERTLRERHGIEVLALYVYPPQVTFCAKPFKGLSDLAGRRVRISNPTQADLLRPFGAVAVQTAFADMVGSIRAGNVDCAITGAMSGHAIGLHEVTTHLHASATTWGVAVFGANLDAWNALPPKVKTTLALQLPRLEKAIWADAERQTREGVACNTGQKDCPGGKPGHMVEVKATPEDEQRLRESFRTSVLPAWLERCGNACVPVWNRVMAPITGVHAEPLPLKR